ncbi:MAG: NifB/NifX family molybdenum-iron cluster-binding protein [Candidatus Izemoplasmatales bacterium]|nr:NifB/NifX family molybdenum-iron cluster-binding protein [Candidatus Izemoplasmatales bacterium]MDD4069131.1 NifB/NifX family molybdenum-iron cluster-binding protein [Candidatus Izemoplasmatales bacterium]MDY0138985.1 NifB/NifX family molybdenum-iron cluster-binding protein [Candidatus Izemoplasmatales bacterium]
MIIVLPTKTSGEKSFISENFGRANYFYVYDTEKKLGEVYVNENLDNPHGVGIKTAEFVLKHKADVLITPRIGGKSQEILIDKVKMYQATDKIVKENIESFLNGELKELF